MKHFFTLLTFLFCSTFSLIHGQICYPDSIYQDSSGGVYPKPISEQNPNAGINIPACIGEPYYFNFTVVVPDTIIFNGFPLAIERIRLRSNDPIQGLPVGITYGCNPTNCDMPKNTMGCIALNGILDPSNDPKDYHLIIYVDIVTSFGVIPTQFPNPALAPGEYFITVKELDDPECLSSTRQIRQSLPVKIAPNPGNGNLMVYMPIEFSGKGTIQLMDLSGKIVFIKQTNRLEGIYELEISDLPIGIYTLQLIGENQIFTAKYIRQ
jgi:hypothetical protein